MIPNERNDYVETLQPILRCFRFNGILPVQLTIKNHKSCFLSSKSIAAFTQSIFLINTIYNFITLCQIVIIVGENFNMKFLIVFAPQIFMKIIVIVIPLDMCAKSIHIKDYWNKWKEFQHEYEKISKTEFNSDEKKAVQKIIFVTNLLILTAEIISYLYMSYNSNCIRMFSDCLNIAVVYYLGAYWYINCMYVKSVARKIIFEVKKAITQDDNGNKLHEIISLWITSSELMEQFYVIHSVLLLIYILQTIVAMVIFAFICMNSSTYIDIYGIALQLNGLIVCMIMIFLFCETAYSIYKQFVINQREMLLFENAMKMGPSMLQSMSLFLETIFVKNPEVCVKGYLTLNRSVFASILAVCINYLIVLRQFQ